MSTSVLQEKAKNLKEVLHCFTDKYFTDKKLLWPWLHVSLIVRYFHFKCLFILKEQVVLNLKPRRENVTYLRIVTFHHCNYWDYLVYFQNDNVVRIRNSNLKCGKHVLKRFTFKLFKNIFFIYQIKHWLMSNYFNFSHLSVSSPLKKHC